MKFLRSKDNKTVMLLNRYLQLVLLNICTFTLGSEVNLSAKDTMTWSGSNIIQTAKSIKKITNDIFFALKLKKSKSNKRLKQYAVTYNYFSSITSKDDENLHQISIASRVDNTVGNVSRDLVDVINEVLNEEPGNNTEESTHDHLQVYVDHFFKNLQYLKNNNGVNNINYDIDNQILQLIRSDEHDNVTKEDPDVDDDYDDSSDDEFWSPGDNTRRIFKGKNTKVRHFPFMASVHIFQNFQCGGSIIKSDLVITAASCLQLAYNNRFFRENPAFLSVRIGSNYYVGGGETIAVLEVYFYPTYDPKSLNNNVAIMRLERRIKFKKRKSRVKKIAIDRNAHRLPKSGVKKGITIVGWGAKGVGNVVRDPWNNVLSVAVLGVYYLKDCQDVYSKKYVTRKHFCAGFFSKGSGACSGDVGGPGIIAGKLAGIISFGSPRCGTPDAPTVFTKIGFYADWIDEIMAQKVHTHSRTTTTPTPFTLPPKRERTTFVMKPIFVKDLLPVPVHHAERQPFHPLRTATKKPKKTHPTKDGPEIEADNLINQFLAIMLGSNERNDNEHLLDKENEAKRVQMKKVDEQKMIMITPADESDSETTVDQGWGGNSDDEELKTKATHSYDKELKTKASRSYSPSTVIVEDHKHREYESNEVNLIEDHVVVRANTPADGDNLDAGDNLEDNGYKLEENILKLIENLDMTSEYEIDKLLAEISDAPHNQETFQEYEKTRKNNDLKSSWKDNVIMQDESVNNDKIFEINDLTGLC